MCVLRVCLPVDASSAFEWAQLSLRPLHTLCNLPDEFTHSLPNNTSLNQRTEVATQLLTLRCSSVSRPSAAQRATVTSVSVSVGQRTPQPVQQPASEHASSTTQTAPSAPTTSHVIVRVKQSSGMAPKRSRKKGAEAAGGAPAVADAAATTVPAAATTGGDALEQTNATEAAKAAVGKSLSLCVALMLVLEHCIWREGVSIAVSR